MMGHDTSQISPFDEVSAVRAECGETEPGRCRQGRWSSASEPSSRSTFPRRKLAVAAFLVGKQGKLSTREPRFIKSSGSLHQVARISTACAARPQDPTDGLLLPKLIPRRVPSNPISNVRSRLSRRRSICAAPCTMPKRA